MFLVNSRLILVIITFLKVPLFPKLRSQFAEFLRENSSKPLNILYQSICVNLGYKLNYFLKRNIYIQTFLGNKDKFNMFFL